MMVLDLDRRLAAHLVAALRLHRRRLASDGRACPRELLDLLAVWSRVSEGQSGSSLDDGDLADDLGRMSPRVVTYLEAGRLLAVSESTIKRLVRDGKLHPVRIGGAARIPVDDIDRYLAGLTTDPTESGVNVPTPRESRGPAGAESMAASASHPPSRTDPPAPSLPTRSELTGLDRVGSPSTTTRRHGNRPKAGQR